MSVFRKIGDKSFSFKFCFLQEDGYFETNLMIIPSKQKSLVEEFIRKKQTQKEGLPIFTMDEWKNFYVGINQKIKKND